MISWVKGYTDKGFAVIPLKPKSKDPAVYWKEFQDKLPSYDDLNRWKSMWENGANIGVICGKVSGGLIVLDLDSPKTFENLKEEYPELTKTWVVKTGRGYHIWLKCKDTTSKGIIRGDKRYATAPPSIHPNGTRYAFSSDSKQNGIKEVAAIPDLQLIKLPKGIRELIVKGDVFGRYRSRSEADMAAICALVRFNYSDAEIKDIFSNHKIGEKFRERGDSYLNFSIRNARAFLQKKDAEIHYTA